MENRMNQHTCGNRNANLYMYIICISHDALVQLMQKHKTLLALPCISNI